jgi:hypothetical protein
MHILMRVTEPEKRNFKGMSLAETQALKYTGVDVGGDLIAKPELLI